MKMQQQVFFDSEIFVVKAIDDHVITAKIEAALTQHNLKQHAFIHVETFAGGVELTGWVRQAAHKQLAVALAADIPGVSYVVNNLSMHE